MPETLKILGSKTVAASTGVQTTTSANLLYTVPAGASAAVSSIVICNSTAIDAQWTLAAIPTAAGTPGVNNYLFFTQTLAANQTTILQLGLTLAAGNTLRLGSSSSSLQVNVFGQELT